MEIEP
jgi:hypothetical protein